MELEGLTRTLAFLDEHSLEVGVLITDRHKQIVKYIGKKHPAIEHRYDVWHVSKGRLFSLNLFYCVLV